MRQGVKDKLNKLLALKRDGVSVEEALGQLPLIFDALFALAFDLEGRLSALESKAPAQLELPLCKCGKQTSCE